ncbi:MAG TPA: carboxypeptidase-like regulatory domain-containing protein [Thermoanaerobaculia bacterium]|jgi:hypothetical protein|nr:carboxypeptidase-like regulatory domain-containing protein [Thermoanaerobaculia bacterium]
MRFNVRKLALLLLLATPAAQAQLWSGPGAVEVQAEDQKGHNLAGAQVLLVYTALNPKDGPPAVGTDSRGRANVGGLAEGAWHVEVSHDGFMTYMAEINVRKGKPELVDATQFRVPGGGTSLMRVKISRGSPTAPTARASAPPPAPAPAPTLKRAPAPAPVEAPPARPEPSRPEPVAPPAQPAPRPQVQPAPEPPRPVTPAPQPPAPAAPSTVPTPAPAPPPAAPAVDAVRVRTAKDRSCVECQPGETAVSTERVILPGGGPGCGDIAARLKGGEVPSGLPAGCNVLRITLPAGTRYTAYRYEVQDGNDYLDCATGQGCPNNTGRWPIDPVLIRNLQGTIILAPFESGPAERERRAVLTVYYTAGKK